MISNPFDPLDYPNCYAGHQYAIDVVEGNIPNGRFIVGACRRYLRDIKDGIYPFDPDRAERYLTLVQKFHHVKGNWKTENIVYEPWQCWIFMNIEGFINTETGKRRFRVVHVEVPRGQGKSLLASQSVLYHLALDNPKGNEISCAATKTDQARIVLDSARAMANKAEAYRKKTGVKVLAHKIVHDKSNSFARALSADDKSLDGLNDILCVIDELHAVDRKLFDVISSGLSKRNDSLLLCITTAGFDVDSVGYSQSSYAKKVALGDVIDDQMFSAIYTCDEKDDIFLESTWKKANPGYGISVDPITFAAKAAKAKEVSSDLANFKVKHLNIWMSEANAFFTVPKWVECSNPEIKIGDFRKNPVWMGIDMASHVDLTSIGYVFFKEDKYFVFDRSYIPEETVNIQRNVLYDDCIGKGHLIKTPGSAINYEIIKNQIKEDKNFFKIQEIAFDPWNSSQLAQDLENERIEMVKFNMNVSNMSEPMKKLDSLIKELKLVNNGSPLLKWAIGNVVAKEDHNQNVYPRKTNEKLKIDPIVAIIMALALALQSNKKGSVYNQRGLRIL